MRLSDIIEEFLKQMMQDSGAVEIQRNELANKFNCVPSQINYVLDTRFTNEHGYYVESRRGGGGYIKIKRVNFKHEVGYLMHIVSAMGNNITQQSAENFIKNFVDYEEISRREGLILKATVSDKVLGSIPLPYRDRIRASILKNALMSLMVQKE